MPDRNDPQYQALRQEAEQAFEAKLAALRASGRKLGPGEIFKLHADETRARGVYEGKNLGQTLGGVIKTAAPIAALAIPGLSPLAAAGLAAGGSAAGGLLAGDRFDPVQAGLSGVAAYGARSVSGGGQGADAAGDVAQTAGRSTIGKIGDWITDDPLRAAQLGLGAVSAVQGAKAAGQANKYRTAALSRIAPPQREDLSGIFADEGNPYSRAGSGTAKRAAVRSLQGAY